MVILQQSVKLGLGQLLLLLQLLLASRMSWTLVRRKNGAEVPIKVSVLDAFRSGPKKSGKYGEVSVSSSLFVPFGEVKQR